MSRVKGRLFILYFVKRMSIESMHREDQMKNRDTGKENIGRIEEEINRFEKSVEAGFVREDCEKILDALDLMLSLHSEQEDRLDGKPYISHPLEVADDIINKYHIDDSDLVTAALLHDAVEDQSRKLLEIKQPDEKSEASDVEELRNRAFAVIGNLYGHRVESIVEGLTNPDFDKISGNLEPEERQKNKISLYERHIKKATEDPGVFIVKLSDFMRNAGNIPSEGQKRDYFIKKYSPVIKNIFIPAFEGMPESHPLFGVRNDILMELNNLYKIYYESSPGR